MLSAAVGIHWIAPQFTKFIKCSMCLRYKTRYKQSGFIYFYGVLRFLAIFVEENFL